MSICKNLIISSVMSLAVAAVPLSGAFAAVAGMMSPPSTMRAQADVPPTGDTNAGEGQGYTAMTKKDCKALKKHKADYSADEYKARASYCKTLLKSKKAAKPKPAPVEENSTPEGSNQ